MPPEAESRNCQGCGENKPHSEFYGRQNKCKPCVIERQRQYYIKNRDHVLSRRKEAPPPSQLPECRRERRAANRDQVNQQKREWFDKNRERVNSQDREWRATNIERLRARPGHAARIAQTARERRKSNLERSRAYTREYNQRPAKNLRKSAAEIIHQRTQIAYGLIPAEVLAAEVEHLKVSRIIRTLKKGIRSE